MLTAIEFFAGSGLVRLGLSPRFKTLWANDICAKKEAIYIANHGASEFHLADIQQVTGEEIPGADLAWASFPCQDVSLAGNLKGMASGTRSGLFWEWIRILWELRNSDKLPPVLIVENVVGFVVADGGRNFRQAYEALCELGYRVGPVVMDASAFIPQSRPRTFLIAVRDGINLSGLSQPSPFAPFHTEALIKASLKIGDPKWIWWTLPTPPQDGRPSFRDICDAEAEFESPQKTEALCKMLSTLHRNKLSEAISSQSYFAGTAYRRTRPDSDGRPEQRLEIRFDGIAGCLRTPTGGSSRQTVIVVNKGTVNSRLMTTRECARLMGAPDSYQLPGSYNDGYRAMGDAVAVPVVRWLAVHLLEPLVARTKMDWKAKAASVSKSHFAARPMTEPGINRNV